MAGKTTRVLRQSTHGRIPWNSVPNGGFPLVTGCMMVTRQAKTASTAKPKPPEHCKVPLRAEKPVRQSRRASSVRAKPVLPRRPRKTGVVFFSEQERFSIGAVLLPWVVLHFELDGMSGVAT